MKTSIKTFVTLLVLAAATAAYAGPSDSAAFAMRAAREYAAKQKQAAEQTIALTKSAPQACKDANCCAKR